MVNQPNDINPLVSVVMPAYKAAYLKEALQSLQDQTYRPLELVICDDCRTDEVRAVVDEYRGILDFPVHYSYNETRLHESKNLAKCVSLASGEYLKFLYDDDVLHPECVERMVDAMRERPGIELVSSRRRRIDEQGRQLPDILATALPFVEDALVDGIGLTSFLAEHTVNFIGEPSTVLCRREAVAAFGDQVMALNGVPIRWVGDLALYVKLLQKGDLAFLSAPWWTSASPASSSARSAATSRASATRGTRTSARPCATWAGISRTATNWSMSRRCIGSKRPSASTCSPPCAGPMPWAR